MFVRTDEKVLKTQGLCGVETGETLPAKDYHGKFLFPKDIKTAHQKLSHKNGTLGTYKGRRGEFVLVSTTKGGRTKLMPSRSD